METALHAVPAANLVGRILAQALSKLLPFIFAALSIASNVDPLTTFSLAAFARLILARGYAANDRHDTAVGLLRVVVIPLLNFLRVLLKVSTGRTQVTFVVDLPMHTLMGNRDLIFDSQIWCLVTSAGANNTPVLICATLAQAFTAFHHDKKR